MPKFNQLFLIVSYLENIQIEPEENGSTLWRTECDEMMTDGEFGQGCHPFACSFFKSWRVLLRRSFFLSCTIYSSTNKHLFFNLCSTSTNSRSRVLRSTVCERTRLWYFKKTRLGAEIYMNEGGLFSAPEDRFNRGTSLMCRRQVYKGIRQDQERLIVTESVAKCALITVEFNQLIYRLLFAIDSKILIFVSSISANHDQTSEAKDLLTIGTYFLEYPSVLHSLSDVVEADSFHRRRSNYLKLSTMLQIPESKDLLRKFPNGMHGLRDITLYVTLLPRNRDSVIQLLDLEIGLAIQSSL